MAKTKYLKLLLSLISIALVGILALQYYWVKYSISSAASDFSINAKKSLSEISKELNEAELSSVSDFFIDNVKPSTGPCKKDIPVDMDKIKKLEKVKLKFPAPFSDIAQEENISQHCHCKNCRLEHYYNYMATFLERRIISPPSVQERIDTNFLTPLISTVLESNNINTSFTYGIYSSETGKFDITIPDGTIDKDELPLLLKKTKYKEKILSHGSQYAGLLCLHFPNEKKIVWKSIWSILVISLLLIGFLISGFIYSMRIILKQKKIAEIKNDFINNITHEFKTPIATISLATDSINNDQIIHNPSKIKKFTSIIKQENKRMLSQVEMVLQTALMEKGDVVLNLSDLDLHEIIKSASDNIALKLKAKNGSLTLNLEAEDPIIEGDEVHIASIINNLLDNANKYTPIEPTIIISTKNVQQDLIISIQDNGLGMAKNQVKQIFDKFYRVSSGNKHDVKGHGLGLTYVNTMVNAHKAEITVQSTEGVGSKFSILFKKNINN